VLSRYQKKSDVPQIEAKMRIAMRTDGNVLLADEFNLIIKPVIDIENNCANTMTMLS
jgi:hypothetical protein